MNTIATTSLALFMVVLASSCQHTPAQWSLAQPQQLLVDETMFLGNVYAVETADDILRLPAATKTELKHLSSTANGIAQRSRTILRYILAHAGDSLTYQHNATKTVSETLASRQANCLSLSLLAYSIAKEVGINVVFQDVKIPEYWSSDTNQTWLNGHVNLRLLQNRQLSDSFGVVLLGSDVVVDFDSSIIKQRFSTQAITTERALAMFYNNKAAEATEKNNAVQAYRYYLAAIAKDPNYAVTWSNLAVLYRQHHWYSLAEQTYHHSLALDPTSTNTLANLAVLYRYSGNDTEAARLEQQVYEKRKTNPWYYVMLGNEAVKANKPQQAISWFQQALLLEGSTHEALFGLAKSYFALNNNIKAYQYLERARRAATLAEDKQRYQHKLSALNQLASTG